jgi:diguanylate cyclase (GGDEF)-like protein/PAS domain S-box-containing protein
VSGMRDKDKTQKQLIKELTALRQRIAQLERAETERKQADEALRESEGKYRSLVERANDGITIIQDGIMKYINTPLAEMWGGSLQELIGTPFTEYIDPDELPTVVDRYNRRMKGEDVPPIYKTVLRRKDGSKAYVELNAGTISYQGKPADLVFVRDITDRKRAEEVLKESEERYRSLIENIRLGIALIDSDHTIIMVNAAESKKFRKSVGELIGKKCFREFEGRDAVCPHCPGVRAMATGQPAVVETEVVKDGKLLFHARLQAYPIFGQDGAVTGFIEVAEDITERKRMEEALRESEEKYRELINGMNDTSWVIDFNGKFIDVNDAAVEVLGYSREELLAMGPHDIDSSLDAVTIMGLIKGMPTDKIQVFETTHTTKDGNVIPVEINSSLVTYQGKRAILSIARDITERKRMDEALRESEERYRLLFENESDAVMVLDAETLRFEDANKAALELYGYSKEELLKLQVPDISAEPEKTMEIIGKLKAGDPDGEKVQIRYHRKKNGTIFPVEITNAVFMSGGREKIIGMIRDITERVQAEETIRKLAYYDALTGLPNRVLFGDRLTLAMSQAHRSQRRLAVMLLDLDQFKDVNDTLGHSVGDELLRSVGKRLTGLLRKHDTVSRMGGDEFFLLLPEIAQVQDAATIAQKVLKVFQEPFVLDDRELNITTSIGVVVYPDDGEDADTLLKKADVALYHAKQKGRNNYQLYTSAIGPELQGDG